MDDSELRSPTAKTVKNMNDSELRSLTPGTLKNMDDSELRSLTAETVKNMNEKYPLHQFAHILVLVCLPEIEFFRPRLSPVYASNTLYWLDSMSQ